ncbi:MAG: hypothetical protein IK062_08960 [Selenomonadaceae bacterium]|nr:hypothetical protein [Selenomonadaceae bacterium]
MSTAVNTMKDFFNAMKNYSSNGNANGVTILNDAVRTVSHFASLQDAINNFVHDVTDTETYSDTAERLKETSGIVLGADNDNTADTGAITGLNAGGSTLKNAVTIVPEDFDLTYLPLPTAGSTTTHTYTGNDGQTFTYYVEWPASFTKMYDFRGVTQEMLKDMSDSEITEKYFKDISTVDSYTDEFFTESITGEQMISGMETVIKGLYGFWLNQGLKLAYDSYGLDFDGKTIVIQFAGGGWFTDTQAATSPVDSAQMTVPTDKISMTINVPLYAIIDPADQNGNTEIEGGSQQSYLDRTIAHELIHATMFGKGIIKDNSPEFFTEGVAELVQGLDDSEAQETDTITSLAENSEKLSKAMALEQGTGTSIRYTAGYMFLRYLCQQSLNVDTQIGNSKTPVNFTYNGGENIISKYKSSDSISYWTDYTGVAVSGDDLILNSSSGKLHIRDARNKVIDIVNPSGNLPSYAYMASGVEDINGENYSGTEMIIGADNASNTITAGNGGSSLWGGNGYATDILNGGSGQDVFFYGSGNGGDFINNADSNDTINLLGITKEQIPTATITDNGVHLQFTDGGSLIVNGQAGNFVLSADGQSYRADYQNKVWSLN